MMMTDYQDPFAESEKLPSVSFREKAKGYTVAGTIVDLPRKVQSRDYDTGELLTFPDGNPKYSVVMTLDVAGERTNLWCPILRSADRSLFNALAESQKVAGAAFAVGGTVAVTLAGEKQGDNPKRNPRKLYTAVYTAPDPFASEDKGDDEPPF